MKKCKLFIFLLMATLLLSGCISFKGGEGQDGGIFKSADKGENWQQKVLMPTITGSPAGFGDANITAIEFDPQDNNAIYAGTEENGLFYTYSAGEAWFHSNQLSQGKVNSIAVDPKDKCTIYVAFGNSIYKSLDCSRTWERVHFEDSLDKFITKLVIDWYNSSIIYAGTSEGNLLKSTDAGRSWTVVKRFERGIVDIAMSEIDSRTLYVGVDNQFINKTPDGGTTWIELEDLAKEYSWAKKVYEISIDKSRKDKDVLITATKYGLLKTTDGGENWSPIKLISAPGKTDIRALALNPQNGNEIYYASATTFYKTANGGQDWTTKKLPTGRAASVLAVDPGNANIIYMGIEKIEKGGLIK